MTTINEPRHHMIRKAVSKRPEAVADVTVDLWERLASELISIIGEGGFQSLYERSVHLTSATFPWMVLDAPTQASDSRFSSLKMSLERRNFTEASDASSRLLITFVDILTLLIGESLTISILRSAWGDNALEPVVKEFQS